MSMPQARLAGLVPRSAPPTLEDWPEPRVTDNAHLLAGYLAGLVSKDAGGPYRVSMLGPVELQHENGNRYRLTIEQVCGEE